MTLHDKTVKRIARELNTKEEYIREVVALFKAELHSRVVEGTSFRVHGLGTFRERGVKPKEKKKRKKAVKKLTRQEKAEQKITQTEKRLIYLITKTKVKLKEED